MARVLCPRGGAVLSQLGARTSVEGVLELDAARELGRLCPGPGAEDCFVTCVWGGGTRKLCMRE
jgi:predicted Rossmann-fold nucleotide-binding protein